MLSGLLGFFKKTSVTPEQYILAAQTLQKNMKDSGMELQNYRDFHELTIRKRCWSVASMVSLVDISLRVGCAISGLFTTINTCRSDTDITMNCVSISGKIIYKIKQAR